MADASATQNATRRSIMTPRRWMILSAGCFLTAIYYIFYEHIPVHVTNDTPLYRVTRNGRQGVVTTGGRIVVPFEWEDIGAFDEHGMARVVKSSSTLHVNSSDLYASMDILQEEIGVIDRNGRQVIPPTLSALSWRFKDQNEFVGVRDQKLIVYDLQGREKLLSDWGPISDCWFGSPGLMAVQKGNDTGWMDRTGRLALYPPDGLSAASNFYDCGLALIRDSAGLLGCIDVDGAIVIDPEWTTIDLASLVAMRKGKTILLDPTFVRVSKGPEEERGSHVCGLYSPKGQCIVPAAYSELRISYEPNLIRGKRADGTYCCLNFDGVVQPLPADLDVLHFHSGVGIILVKRLGKYGWVTQTGQVAIPFDYDEVLPQTAFLDNKLAVVSKAKKWGAIDEKGQVSIPLEYDRIQESLISFGLYVASKDGLTGCLNAVGKTVIPFQFTYFGEHRTSEYFVGSGRNGNVVFDKSGKQIATTGLLLSDLEREFRGLDFSTLTQLDCLSKPLFAARNEAAGGEGAYDARKGLLIPPVHIKMTISECGLTGWGLVLSDSLLDRSLSWSKEKLNELLPSVVPKSHEVCVVYDFDGNVIWRNDARQIDVMKALGLGCWGVYCFRRSRTGRRKQTQT